MAAVEMSCLNALPAHLVAFATEEFPHPAGHPRASGCENARPGRPHRTRFTCAKIAEEVGEEGGLDEDRARRSYQRSLESLRRCTQARHWLISQDSGSISTQGSMESSDSDLI
uniref:Uncharacterized protein n=1 Tax=Electrophorus electricus TaxID=8005 RepID=A0A4W4GSN5_ELEEL